MSIQSLPRTLNQPLPENPPSALGMNPAQRPPKNPLTLFDLVELRRTQPSPKLSWGEKTMLQLLHPIRTQKLQGKLSAQLEGSGESAEARVIMYQKLYNTIDLEGQQRLEGLLNSGALLDNSADDNHSTLYHLYALLTTPRATHLKNATLAEETLRILYKPYTITQKFEPLSANIADEMLRTRNGMGKVPGTGVNPGWRQVQWEDLDVQDSGANCVASSLMFYMADKKPSELARQINEMTSPMLAFYKKVKTSDIAPDKQDAYRLLQEYKIPYTVTGPDEIVYKATLPHLAYLRTVNDTFINLKGRRTGVETATELLYTSLASKGTYDSATDYRMYTDTPGAEDKGLTPDENAMLQTLVKGSGSFRPVIYQIVASRETVPAEQQNTPYLYGYTRTFEQITGDLLASLRMGQPVIIGFVNTDPEGSIISPHEITLTGAYKDPETGEINFIAADSDDNSDEPVIWPARNIPQIHHAVFPAAIADKIEAEMAAVPGYYIASDEDKKYFDPISQTKDKLPDEAFLPPAENAANPVTGPSSASPPANPWTQNPASPQNPFQAVALNPPYTS